MIRFGEGASSANERLEKERRKLNYRTLRRGGNGSIGEGENAQKRRPSFSLRLVFLHVDIPAASESEESKR